MTTAETENSTPASLRSMLWPGPRPYGEDRAHLFFGREKEVKKLLSSGRLAILSAESGSGKSSLLAAGFIPTLRRQRAGGLKVPPALLLREWGSGGRLEPTTRLLEAGFAAVAAMKTLPRAWEAMDHPRFSDSIREPARPVAEQLRLDFARLDQAINAWKTSAGTAVPTDPEQHALSGWHALCEASNGLVLVLDQVEELMGSASLERDPVHTERTVDAIGSLFRAEPRLTMVIALRTEYAQTLHRYLNRHVGSLAARTIFLDPLPAGSVQAIVTAAADAVGISSIQVEPFVRMIVPVRETPERRPLSAFSLLGVQAVLSGYEQWLTSKSGSLSISPADLAEYLASLRAKAQESDKRPPPGIARTESEVAAETTLALERWVHEQLDLAVALCPSPATRARTATDRLKPWLLQPLMPKLATLGGYKQHIPVLDIHRDLVKRLFDVSGTLDASVNEALERWLDHGGQPKLTVQAGWAIKLSGIGRELVKDIPTRPAQAEALVSACLVTMREVLESLSDGVLKIVGQGRFASCELVHDGLSGYVSSWSESAREKCEFVLGAPVQIRGENFRWRAFSPGRNRPISNLSWIGTTLGSQVGDQGGAEISDAVFEDCDFTGMFFRHCKFKRVTFRRCRLDAAVFFWKDDSVVDSPLRPPASLGSEAVLEDVEFEYCSIVSTAFLCCQFGKGIVFRGELPRLSEHIDKSAEELPNSSNLTSVSFTRCSTTDGHAVEFEQCVLRFAQFGPFDVIRAQSPDARPALRFRRCDMMNAWIYDVGTGSVTVDEHCRTIGLVSYSLFSPAWLDRESSIRVPSH